VILASTSRTSSITPTRWCAFSGVTAWNNISRIEKTRAAVERVLEICGEAMNGLYKVAPSIAEKIPHSRDVIGFRNILAHGYAEIDHNKVYDIAIRHAPDLLAAVRIALKDFPEPKS
jgi:uncharacterized protein with HEPN domain